ncbi:hypothetical protein ACQP2P_20805 [Dactylosporangium sp. CA-139114]|uniref:hypothetical protein n=1 Tax=Dactylosporangium sp. CA-139114 TaxID=3239931 RepID=UPI003D96D657
MLTTNSTPQRSSGDHNQEVAVPPVARAGPAVPGEPVLEHLQIGMEVCLTPADIDVWSAELDRSRQAGDSPQL